MAKIADKYFETNEWKIIEKGFNPQYGEVAESIFSLGNEYMGVRGYFEEGYSGKKLVGSYFNGIYEMTEPDYGHYKGIVDFMEYMINSVNWLYTRIELDGEILDLATSEFLDFERELDLRTGILSRSFIWKTKSNKKVKIRFERFLSMSEVETGAQKITITPVDFTGKIKVIAGLDFTEIHQTTRKNLWNCEDKKVDITKSEGKAGELRIGGTTLQTNKKVYSSAIVYADCSNVKEIVEEKKIALEMELDLVQGEEKTLTKLVKNLTFRDGDKEDEYNAKIAKLDLHKLCYEQMMQDNKDWWSKVWQRSDIVIEGDEENQQGIRFCIFQMFQTYHGAVEGSNIGAKGLTGEAYNGNAFWDTETCCLPFFMFNNKEGARNLLYFRYKTLDEARNRAKMLDCKGAYYPIATISGRECCNLWQHASLQLQASTAVAYGIWFYEKMFNDIEFIKLYGLEMLIEICRMLASRGDYDKRGRYGYYCVMGPDEFQMMVHNNTYTNYMAKFTFEYTLDVIDRIKNCGDSTYKNVVSKIALDEKEIEDWKNKSESMLILYDEETKLFEQHAGFYDLPHMDIHSIPISEFPLYDHWSYERIYRNDMIKQPDVLMFMFLFSSKFTQEQMKANYEYYEPLCIHESSLSPSVHSIIASQLGKENEAYEFFRFATRMDLDNYNRNTNQGLHTTSIAAAWMNIVYGFGGLRSDGDMLSLNPSIPKEWKGYTFKIEYQNEILEVVVSNKTVEIKGHNGKDVKVRVYGKEVILGKDNYLCNIQ